MMMLAITLATKNSSETEEENWELLVSPVLVTNWLSVISMAGWLFINLVVSKKMVWDEFLDNE